MSATAQNITAEAVNVVKSLVWEIKPEELVTYVCVTIMALIPLYIGCQLSLAQKKPAVRIRMAKCMY
jgi:hypothetical protein